jgi:superfamily II DNA or RNA helicase
VKNSLRSLTATISGAVSRIFRERGERYYLQGAVNIIEGSAWRVAATVQGTRRYEVIILRAQEFFEVSCSCPFYDRELTTCKHIWAVFLAAEQNGFLDGLGDRAPTEIREEIPGLFGYQQGERARTPRRSEVSWKQQLHGLIGTMEAQDSRSNRDAAPERYFVYLIDTEGSVASERLTIQVAQRTRKADGSWGKLKSQKIRLDEIAVLPDPADRRILALLTGAREETHYGYSPYYYDSVQSTFTLVEPLWDVILPVMCATGRCVLSVSRDTDQHPLVWDEGDPWGFAVEMTLDDSGERYLVHGMLKRGDAAMDLKRPALILAGGLVFYDNRIARLRDYDAFSWITLLREQGHLSVPKKEADEFVNELFRLPRRPRLTLPQEFSFEEVSCRPNPVLTIRAQSDRKSLNPARLIGNLSFEYDGILVPHRYPGQSIHQQNRRRLINRDFAVEDAAVDRLKELGFRRPHWPGSDSEFEFSPDRLSKVVRALSEQGWRVEAEGKIYRTVSSLRLDIKSGVDWFELEGGAQFDQAKVALPKLLRAIRRGEDTVRLDDGTLGILPEDWLEKYSLLAGLGSVQGDRLRFSRQQVGLLDALIATEQNVAVDAGFNRLRQELYSFEGVVAADPTADFVGQLRDYQRDGLGWLGFLQRFGFGGCLADDMGLGKTVQVLALLESRRELHAHGQRPTPRPSLVVVPRSLVFHWKREAARFTPKLRLLDHTGSLRLKPGEHFSDYDVVITTYGTLRRDALEFKAQQFDYCILDEAQAIKNAGTLSAKAARLLRADHRLAMSGTPVENHLGELWSLFEFLNPGLLGSATLFGRAGRNPEAATRNLMARALRPFVLRRTKSQVARELPAKTEQTIFCDLEGREKRHYDELRAYYRARLLKDFELGDSSRVKFQALEALLRLRQAACHPGLIDKNKVGEPSAKIDTLMAQLEQVREEGHKALVFSQFTSLLAIVRDRLDRDKIAYAYLDGRTRDREARVEQFQNDPTLKLFLISLKAGGLGLNLYAAEYVYLLDPWWNPAVEAQAIDRAHRIGQTRQVFAYRLIARGTVEEKVLELQQNKRDLADAIITADNSLLHNLTREDLELLLS